MGKTRANMICEDCGYIGTAKTQISGSIWIELLLYTIAIIVAVPTFFVSLLIPFVYSIHRRTVPMKVCRKCGGKVISIYEPKGEKLLKKMAFEEIKK